MKPILNQIQIDQIIKRYADGNVSCDSIAKDHGVSETTVWYVVNKKGAYNKSILPPEEQDKKRFWSKVKKTDTCWNWIASCNQSGYGRIGISGKLITAHRYSWEIQNGKIPKGKLVLHKCDNSKCVNPDHLFIGTDKDNMDDMNKKHRGHNKLTANQVREIKRKYIRGKITCEMLGKEYGVNKSSINEIVRGKSYRFYK